MIIGAVDANLDARITFFVEDVTGQTHLVDAVIDTGFSGFLSLISAQIAILGLPWVTQDRGMLADGSIHLVDIYSTSVIWDNQTLLVHVYAMDVPPLVGMKLLEGNELRIKVFPGGLVHIDTTP